MAGTLSEVVTAAATDLVSATAANSAATSERVLADLVRYFGVDLGFLFNNDHARRAMVLAAASPRCENVSGPPRLGDYCAAGPVFASAERLKVPAVLHPEPPNADYQRCIEALSGIAGGCLACAPLLSGEHTTGILGLIKRGDRDWAPEELSALQATATLFAQLQARLVAEARVHYLAGHDDLTGLPNRRALTAHLDDRLAEGRPGPVAVVLVDLDRFKVVNDYLGHNAGDRFLKAFAQLLCEAVDVDAVIARPGGDEFVVVPLTPMDAGAVETFAGNLQKRLHEPIDVDGEMLTRTVSIGVVVGHPGQDRASELLHRVTQATASAQSSGGGAVAGFSSQMAEMHAALTDIEVRLEGAIDTDTGQLLLRYLPEFALHTGEVLAAEALVRWRHPTLGLLLPDSFIGVAESTNLAGKLGRYVRRSAFRQFALWRSHGAGRDALLRVNVSPDQLVNGGFVGAVAATLDEFGLDAGAVCLEITESVVVHDIDAARKTLLGLKDVGVRIALDDFGTGYSVLSSLKTLPVDTVKIDKGFVGDLGTNTGDLAIVRSIISLADAFGLDVVAEGVETAVAARTLLDLGCRRAQGFLLSPPLDSAEMESLLARRFVPTGFLKA